MTTDLAHASAAAAAKIALPRGASTGYGHFEGGAGCQAAPGQSGRRAAAGHVASEPHASIHSTSLWWAPHGLWSVVCLPSVCAHPNRHLTMPPRHVGHASCEEPLGLNLEHALRATLAEYFCRGAGSDGHASMP
eukprot:8144859-Alexandrium_andersonii.AAC.1